MKPAPSPARLPAPATPNRRPPAASIFVGWLPAGYPASPLLQAQRLTDFGRPGL